jgi:hypothetical protein
MPRRAWNANRRLCSSILKRSSGFKVGDGSLEEFSGAKAPEILRPGPSATKSLELKVFVSEMLSVTYSTQDCKSQSGALCHLIQHPRPESRVLSPPGMRSTRGISTKRWWLTYSPVKVLTRFFRFTQPSTTGRTGRGHSYCRCFLATYS